MLYLRPLPKFKKEIELAKSRGKDLEKIKHVLNLLSQESPLPEKMRNHKLKRNSFRFILNKKQHNVVIFVNIKYN